MSLYNNYFTLKLIFVAGVIKCFKMFLNFYRQNDFIIVKKPCTSFLCSTLYFDIFTVVILLVHNCTHTCSAVST